MNCVREMRWRGIGYGGAGMVKDSTTFVQVRTSPLPIREMWTCGGELAPRPETALWGGSQIRGNQLDLSPLSKAQTVSARGEAWAPNHTYDST